MVGMFIESQNKELKTKSKQNTRFVSSVLRISVAINENTSEKKNRKKFIKYFRSRKTARFAD